MVKIYYNCKCEYLYTGLRVIAWYCGLVISTLTIRPAAICELLFGAVLTEHRKYDLNRTQSIQYNQLY